MDIQRSICTCMLHSSIHNSQKVETAQMTATDEWINTLQLYKYEYYSSIKINLRYILQYE